VSDKVISFIFHKKKKNLFKNKNNFVLQEDCGEPVSLPNWNWSSVYPNWWWTCHHKHHCNDTPHECFYCWRNRGRPDSPTPQDLIAFELARKRLKQSARSKTGRNTRALLEDAYFGCVAANTRRRDSFGLLNLPHLTSLHLTSLHLTSP